MIIIRVECATNQMRGDYGEHRHINNGCYSGNGIAYEAIDQQADHEESYVSSSDNRHPCPEMDGISSYHGPHICAFKDWHQFKSWFPFIRGLESVRDRARLAFYHVPDERVQVGRYQVVANCKYMHLIKVLHTTATREQVEEVYTSHFIGEHLCLTQSPSCMAMALLPSF